MFPGRGTLGLVLYGCSLGVGCILEQFCLGISWVWVHCGAVLLGVSWVRVSFRVARVGAPLAWAFGKLGGS